MFGVGVAVLWGGCGRVSFNDDPRQIDAAIDGVPDAPACEQPAHGDFAVWPMPNSGAGMPNTVRHTVRPDGISVLDEVTQLEWQRDVQDNKTQAEGAAYCASLVQDGNCDWRLPERIELISIADYQKVDPGIDEVAFPSTPSTAFWSSTMRRNSTTEAWYVSFSNGSIGTTTTDGTYGVRCVRGGGPQMTTHYQTTADTVTDMQTGLTWERVVQPQSHDHDSAIAYCAALGLDGGGWRSPSINELESLVDVSRTSPSINPLVFPDTPSSLFWSRDIMMSDTTQGWTVDFDNGNVARALTTALPVRCVR